MIEFSRMNALLYKAYFLSKIPGLTEDLEQEFLAEMGLIKPSGSLTKLGRLLFTTLPGPVVMKISDWKVTRSAASLASLYMTLCLGRPVALKHNGGAGSFGLLREKDCINTLKALVRRKPQPWDNAMYMAGLPVHMDEEALWEDLEQRTPYVKDLSEVRFQNEFWTKYAGCLEG